MDRREWKASKHTQKGDHDDDDDDGDDNVAGDDDDDDIAGDYTDDIHHYNHDNRDSNRDRESDGNLGGCSTTEICWRVLARQGGRHHHPRHHHHHQHHRNHRHHHCHTLCRHFHYDHHQIITVLVMIITMI